jgi:hypothetical protein
MTNATNDNGGRHEYMQAIGTTAASGGLQWVAADNECTKQPFFVVIPQPTLGLCHFLPIYHSIANDKRNSRLRMAVYDQQEVDNEVRSLFGDRLNVHCVGSYYSN